MLPPVKAVEVPVPIPLVAPVNVTKSASAFGAPLASLTMTGERIPLKFAAPAPKILVETINRERCPAVPARLAVGLITKVPWLVRARLPTVSCELKAPPEFKARMPPPLMVKVPVPVSKIQHLLRG